ncbi:unnamed protein product, partial [Prorocentrum cordatum]
GSGPSSRKPTVPGARARALGGGGGEDSMPKVQKSRTKYHDRAPPLDPDAEEEPVEDEEAAREAEDGPPPVVMGRRRQKRREDFMRKFEFVNYVRQQDSAAETRAAWRGSGRYEAQSALCNDHNAACCCCCCIDVVPCSLLVLYSCSGICE